MRRAAPSARPSSSRWPRSAANAASCPTPSPGAGSWAAASGSTCASRTPTARCWAPSRTPRSATRGPRWTRPRRPAPAGGRCRSTTAPRSCSRRPSCSPGRGGPGSTPRPCSGRARPATRPRSTPRASSSTSGGSTSHFAREILAEQPPLNAKGVWNRTDHRPLEGFVYAITPVQLHGHRGQPADRARAHGQHGGVEAVADPEPGRAGHHGAARGRGTAPGRHQPRHRRRAQRLEGRPGRPRPRRHPLHRLDRHLPAPLERGRRQPAPLPLLPAARRRDRRQGLRPRPPVGRPRRAAHRAGPRGVRVPGPEVLGRVPRLRPRVALEADQGRPRRHHQRPAAGRRHRLLATSWAPSSTTGRSPRTPRPSTGSKAPPRSRSSPAAPTTTRVGYFVRPTVLESSDPTDESFRTEYFGPILSVHVYPDARYDATLEQMESFSPYALTGSIIAQDRVAIADATRAAALRGRQLLRQRQADRRRRRAAALRRRSRVRHQRQGGRGPEPAALDECPVDQGDLRARHVTRLPAHGLSGRTSAKPPPPGLVRWSHWGP